MLRPWATLDEPGDALVLRFERRLAHPPEKVFRAISHPDELEHWFPARVATDWEVGSAVAFTFEDMDADAPSGTVLAFDPPRLLAYRWGDDVLRWELFPEGDGCRLVFTHTLAPDGDSGGRPGLARNAAGWDVCLAALEARLGGAPGPGPEWFPLLEAYVERLGLGEGDVTAAGARFRRDVVQTPDQVWALLTDGDAPVVGEPAPRRFAPTPPGAVESVEPERALAFAADDGSTVRWTLAPRMPGTLVVVEWPRPADGLPGALARWQVHVELLVAALAGTERCWPDERVAALEARYAARLAHFSAAGHAIR